MPSASHHAESRESPSSAPLVAKGEAVVAPDRRGQAVLFKAPLERRAHRRRLRVAQRTVFEHHPAELIAHRQRLAPPVRVAPPALEVHRPHLVRYARLCPVANPPALPRTPPLFLLHPPRFFEHPLDAAFTRRTAPVPLVEFIELARPPVPVPLLEQHDPAHHFFRQPLRRTLRPPAPLPHPREPFLLESLLPFIPHSRADAILPAQFPEIVRLHGFDREFASLVHLVFGFPRHPLSPFLEPGCVTCVLNPHPQPSSEWRMRALILRCRCAGPNVKRQTFNF